MECLSRMSAEDGPKILCELAALTKAKRVKLTKTRGAKHEISLLHGNLLVLLKDVLVQDKARYKPKAFTKSRVAHDDTPKVPQSEDAKPVACDVTQSATVLNDNPSIVQVSKLKQMAETYLLADDEEFIVMMDRLNNPSIAQFVGVIQNKATKKEQPGNMRLSISSCQTKDALSKDPVYLQGLNTRQMCEHLEICHGIPNYQEADAPVEETFRHLSKINLIEQVKDVVDRAYIVSCWSLYCQKKGFEQMYVSQGATTKKAAMKMHDSIRSHILQSFNLEDQQNKDELVQISVRMNARASTKDKFSPDHYRVKNVFAECQPAYVYWDNACKRGAKVDQVVQLLGTAVLEMSELPWSLLYNSSAKDLEQILFYLQKNVKLDQKTTVCNSNGLLSEETSEPSVGIQEIADASQVTASFTSQKLDIKVQPPPVQSTSKVIMSDLPTVAEIASKGKQSNEGALIENALGSRTSGSRRK